MSFGGERQVADPVLAPLKALLATLPSLGVAPISVAGTGLLS